MKTIKTSLAAILLASIGAQANAESFAISNATVHTATSAGVIENATVVVEDGVIKAINPESLSVDSTIDAQGKILTPGFIGSVNNLGLVEVGAVSRSRDAGEKKADITFDPSLAFNPKSTVIPYSRKGGITSNLVFPSGGDSIFNGQAFVVNLSGEFDSVIANKQGVVVDLGSKSKGSRAFDLQKLIHKLEDAQKAIAKAKKSKKDDKSDKKDAKSEKRDQAILKGLLKGETPLYAFVDRATDILAMIDIKKEFGVNVVLVQAGDAVVVADELAKAEIPVILDPMRNLPGSFDALHTGLDNAATLNKAGVKVVMSNEGDTHNLYQLRYNVGNAIANGYPRDEALKAVTSTPAEVFNLNSGKIEVGKAADLVLWSADPFELSSKVESLWINGKVYSTESRQDKLRKRYTTDSDMPRAYTK